MTAAVASAATTTRGSKNLGSLEKVFRFLGLLGLLGFKVFLGFGVLGL